MIDELTLKDNKNAKISPMKSMQHVSLSGRPYPNIVHNVQSPALKRTGGTTRDCRSCLQVHNFLLMEGGSAFYRKFLRISDIRELWAATRILSRGSMSVSSYLYV